MLNSVSNTSPSLREKIASGATVPVRVLVVDDSALMRKMLSEIVASDPALELLGTARDGKDALEKVRLWKPDVITLDVEMPNLDGLAFLEALFRENPTRVLMVSSLTTAGADVTFACLQRGAIDFVAKPSGSISLNIHECCQEITEKIRSTARARLLPFPETGRTRTVPSMPPVPTMENRPHHTGALVSFPAQKQVAFSGQDSLRLVTIAASTGGPAALQSLIPRLPENAAYLLVQHLPPGFTLSLAQRLNQESALTVREACAGELPERGTVLIAPGGQHLLLDETRQIVLSDDPPLWGVRPAADLMMRSAAMRYGSRTVGIVLTGMGRDGAMGAKAIRQAGGVCLAQDEATSVVYGMPRAAVETGAVLRSVPLPAMPDVLAEILSERIFTGC